MTPRFRVPEPPDLDTLKALLQDARETRDRLRRALKQSQQAVARLSKVLVTRTRDARRTNRRGRPPRAPAPAQAPHGPCTLAALHGEEDPRSTTCEPHWAQRREGCDDH